MSYAFELHAIDAHELGRGTMLTPNRLSPRGGSGHERVPKTELRQQPAAFRVRHLDHYGDALHAAALATITGEPINRPDAFARTLEVVLATYSVIVFATLAGTLGAYFLESAERRRSAQPDAI